MQAGLARTNMCSHAAQILALLGVFGWSETLHMHTRARSLSLSLAVSLSLSHKQKHNTHNTQFSTYILRIDSAVCGRMLRYADAC